LKHKTSKLESLCSCIFEFNLVLFSISNLAVLYFRSYSLWETDDVIGTELYRNMGLALVCVFLTTLVLLANLSAALMVLLCVLLALLDIGGFMYFWGLTIDTGTFER
jgi:predicted RND superfamily exporter protein